MNIRLVFLLLLITTLSVSCQRKDEPLLLFDVVDVSPGNVMRGDTITITGTGFITEMGKMSLRLGGVPVQIISASSVELKVKVPGTIDFGTQELSIARKGYLTSTNIMFVSKYPVPVVTGISPESGAVGSIVTIHGKNLGTTEDAIRLAFSDAQGLPLYLNADSSPVSPFTPILSASTESIQVRVPSGAFSGPIHLWVYPDKDSEPDYRLSASTSDFTVSP